MSEVIALGKSSELSEVRAARARVGISCVDSAAPPICLIGHWIKRLTKGKVSIIHYSAQHSRIVPPPSVDLNLLQPLTLGCPVIHRTVSHLPC